MNIETRDSKAPFEIIASFTEVKSAADGKLTVKGYASTFSDRDRHDDVIDPYAFDASIEQYMQNPKLLAFHDHSRPIGKATEVTIDEKGLYVIGEISNADSVKDIRQQIEEGVLSSFSIGGYFHRQLVNGQKMIHQVDLVEISVVAVPANPYASFTVVKAFRSEAKQLPPLEYGAPVSFQEKSVQAQLEEAKSLVAEVWETPIQPMIKVFVEGNNTSEFLSYLYGTKAYGYQSYQFSVPVTDVHHLHHQMRRIKEYAERTGVRVNVHVPRDLDAWMQEEGAILS